MTTNDLSVTDSGWTQIEGLINVLEDAFKLTLELQAANLSQGDFWALWWQTEDSIKSKGHLGEKFLRQ